MTVLQLPSGSWRAIAYLGRDASGRQVRKSFSHTDKKTAIALAAAYEASHGLASGRGSFAAESRLYFKERGHLLSPATLAEYSSRSRCLQRRHKAFSSLHVKMIDAKVLQRLIGDLDALGLAPKTIKNYIYFISAVLNFAGLDMPNVELPAKVAPDIYVPTDAEVRRLIAAADGDVMYVPVLLATFGPLRRGEICALKYPRDFDGDVIHVRETVSSDGRRLHVKKPKTFSSDRFIRLPAFVVDPIREQGYVTRLKPDHITHRFKTLLRHAGLPAFRFHDLRHYCVSTLHAQGVATASIVKRCGHSSDQMVQRVYRHILADQDAAQTEKALRHFEAVMFG